jgi:hypothetical protein
MRIIADTERNANGGRLSRRLAENMMLRQQRMVAARAVKRPQIRGHERGLFVVLCSLLRMRGDRSSAEHERLRVVPVLGAQRDSP